MLSRGSWRYINEDGKSRDHPSMYSWRQKNKRKASKSSVKAARWVLMRD